MNKVILMGRVGSDVALKYTQGGVPVAVLSLVTNEYSKDKNTGERKQLAEWHRVVFWNRQAEVASEFATKGSQVLVSGRLHTRQWDDNGVTRYMTEVVGRELELLGSKQAASSATPAQSSKSPTTTGGAVDNFAAFDDDIPY